LIQIKNLEVYYGKHKALENINLKIPEKEIFAIIGPSGCGKSTFLRCLNRMNDLVNGIGIRGEIIINSKDIYGSDISLTKLRRKVGMVFQRPNPFPKSIFENVAFGPRVHGQRKKKVLTEIVEQSLKKAGLWREVKDKLHKSALALSGGQQQRLCIARTLAVEPEIILMDEPASALDPISTKHIERLILKLKERYSIVIVTHNMLQARRISDETAFFLSHEGGPGRLIECDKTEKIFINPREKKQMNL